MVQGRRKEERERRRGDDVDTRYEGYGIMGRGSDGDGDE